MTDCPLFKRVQAQRRLDKSKRPDAVGVYLVLNIAVILILEIIDALLVDIDTFRVELNIQLMLRDRKAHV